MAAIGTGWADGAWIVDSWVDGSWSKVANDVTQPFSPGGGRIVSARPRRADTETNVVPLIREIEDFSEILAGLRGIDTPLLPATQIADSLLERFRPRDPELPLSRIELFELLAKMQAGIISDFQKLESSKNLDAEKFTREIEELEEKTNQATEAVSAAQSEIEETAQIRVIHGIQVLETEEQADRRKLLALLAALVAA